MHAQLEYLRAVQRQVPKALATLSDLVSDPAIGCGDADREKPLLEWARSQTNGRCVTQG